MNIYRIKHAVTGLYSLGGNSPRWSKKGKIWKNIGHVKTHLRNAIPWHDPHHLRLADMENWILITYEIKEDPVGQVNILSYVRDLVAEEHEKEMRLKRERQEREDLKKMTLANLTPAQRKVLGY